MTNDNEITAFQRPRFVGAVGNGARPYRVIPAPGLPIISAPNRPYLSPQMAIDNGRSLAAVIQWPGNWVRVCSLAASAQTLKLLARMPQYLPSIRICGERNEDKIPLHSPVTFAGLRHDTCPGIPYRWIQFYSEKDNRFILGLITRRPFAYPIKDQFYQRPPRLTRMRRRRM